MKKILIPIDGSQHSQRAIEKGKEFAKVFGSNIVLLNVRNLLIPYLSFEETQQFMNMVSKNSDEMLNLAKESLSDIEGNVEIVSLQGDIASTIIEYIEEQDDIDLVIMGSQGLNAGKLKGLFLGSIANKIIHNTNKSILIVR